ncbi:hypothetical protein EON66_09280 [archaeon]|nr:MAG: hypothetical protein EON66_09280 [archaeon]
MILHNEAEARAELAEQLLMHKLEGLERDVQRQEARFVEDVLRKEYNKMLAFLATQRRQLYAWTLNMVIAFAVGIVLPIALVSLSDVWDWYAARLTFSCPELPGTGLASALGLSTIASAVNTLLCPSFVASIVLSLLFSGIALLLLAKGLYFTLIMLVLSPVVVEHWQTYWAIILASPWMLALGVVFNAVAALAYWVWMLRAPSRAHYMSLLKRSQAAQLSMSAILRPLPAAEVPYSAQFTRGLAWPLLSFLVGMASLQLIVGGGGRDPAA